MRFRISTLAGHLTALALCALTSQAHAQTSAAANESGHLRLYKYAQAIGDETYRVEADGQALVLTDTFHFTDRSTPVDLDTTFRATRDLTPLSFASKGKVARLSFVPLAEGVDVIDVLGKD